MAKHRKTATEEYRDATAVAAHCAAAQRKLVEDYRRATRGAPDSRQQVLFLWALGRGLLAGCPERRWAGGALQALAEALGRRYPDVKLAPASLRRVQGFAEAWPDEVLVRQLLCHLSWAHHVVLLGQLSDAGRRAWYALRAVELGWDVRELTEEIEGDLFGEGCLEVARHERRKRPDRQMPWELGPVEEPGDAAQVLVEIAPERFLLQVLDAFVRPGRNFIHLGMGIPVRGRFLPRTGNPMRTVSHESHDDVADTIDLLLHHVKMQRHLMVMVRRRGEAADGAAEPRSRRINTLLTAVDEMFNSYWDRQSVGLQLTLLDARVEARYALPEDVGSVLTASSGLTKGLPKPLQRFLPGVDKLEAELSRMLRRGR